MSEDEIDNADIDDMDFWFWCPSCLEPAELCRCADYPDDEMDEWRDDE